MYIIDLQLGRNGRIQFNSLDEVTSLIQKERAAWHWLNGRFSRSHTDDSVVRTFRSGWDQIVTSITSKKDVREIEKQLINVYGDSGRCILSDSPIGRYIKSVSQRNTYIANAVTLCYSWEPGKSIPERYNEFPEWQIACAIRAAFTESILGLQGDLSSIRIQGNEAISKLNGQIEAFDKSQADFSADGKELFENIKKEYKVLSEGCNEQYNVFMNTAKTEYEDLKKFYQTELALKAPVEYWQGVANKNRRLTYIWGATFPLILGGMVYCIIEYHEAVLSFLKDLGKESVAIIFTLAIGTAGFWVLRMISKIFLSNYQRWVDAAERETMVKTFLALRREGHITDEKLDLVLAPLFRPGATGLVKDDSAPEYGVASMISKELTRR